MEKLLSLSAKRIANEIIETIDLIDDILWEDYGRLEVGFKPSVVKVLPFKKVREEFVDFLWNKFYIAKSYNFTGHRFKYRENEFVLTSVIDEETSEISAYLNTLGSQFKLVTF